MTLKMRKALLDEAGLLNFWHAHGDSNPGCRRERAVS